jgi:glycosyltransferase involved in cell wall biosynthesis
MSSCETPRTRLAIVVSHPIQYYAPLYQRLAKRQDLDVRIFFTWHAGQAAVEDHGFKRKVAWDIPLTTGYEFELVPNVSSNPGTDHFFGLRNPSLIQRIISWRPDVVHITGWAWLSHVNALRVLHERRIRTLFRGDSHLLDIDRRGLGWWGKRTVLRHIYSWPTSFLVVGTANRTYYETFGVKADRLFPCPHSIDVARFAEPAESHEQEAEQWRKQLGIAPNQRVLLFAGKFESRKQPLALMKVVQALPDPRLVLILVGDGEQESQIKAYAAARPERFRVLPFQNQSRMPIVYRLGDVFILPSKSGETWGLAVNEALACGRPALVSDRVGCAADVIDRTCGRVFPWDDHIALAKAIDEILGNQATYIEMRSAAAKRSWQFDLARTEADLMTAVHEVSGI